MKIKNHKEILLSIPAWPEQRHRVTKCIGKNTDTWNSQDASGNGNRAADTENGLEVSQKVNYRAAMLARESLFEWHPRELKHLFNWIPKVQIGLLHNSQDET